MSLKSEAQAALAATGSFSLGERVVAASDASRHWECRLLALDTIGCAFDTFAVRSEELRDAAPEQLRRLSDRLSKQLTYLLEPIRIVEVDQNAASVQLRSDPPQRDSDGASYYELVVRSGGEMRLHRYLKPRGAPRQIVPAQVTREVLLRLVGDFSSALD